MNHIPDPSDEEFETALAAAAYAIALLAEEGSLTQRQSGKDLRRSPTKAKNKKEDSMKRTSDTIKISRWLSGKDAEEDWRLAGGKSRRKPTSLEQRMLEDVDDKKMPEDAMGTAPTVKKTPTFSDTYLNDTGIVNRRWPEEPKGSVPTMKKKPTFSDKYLKETGNKSKGEPDMREDIADGKMPEDRKQPEKPTVTAPTMKKTPTFFEHFNYEENKRPEGEQDMRQGIADKKMPEKAMGATHTVKKTPTFSDKYLNDTGIADTRRPKRLIGTTPTIKKVPTLSDKYLKDAGSERIGGGQDMGARQTEDLWYQNNIKPQKQGTEADSWEREEMAKIRKWHEKLNSTILEWENEKKMKARRRKERKESKIEQRRARLLQEYRNELLRIDKIAGGARAVSDERKRKDEFKTKEMAKVIRSTGKVPHTWFCI